jgi:hypothetical protein
MMREGKMHLTNQRLVRELIAVVLIKLVALGGLWFFFFHSNHVSPEAEAVSARLGVRTTVSTASQGSHQGEHHGQ